MHLFGKVKGHPNTRPIQGKVLRLQPKQLRLMDMLQTKANNEKGVWSFYDTLNWNTYEARTVF